MAGSRHFFVGLLGSCAEEKQIHCVAAAHAGYYVEALMIFNTAGTLIKPQRNRLNNMHNGISGLTLTGDVRADE